MTTFYAQPYALDHTGFYFANLEDYENGMANLERRGCEEVEIQFIDGEVHLASLASEAWIGQGQVTLWFERIEDLNDTAAEQIRFLLDCGYSLEDALDRYEGVSLFDGTPADYAAELTEDMYDLPDNLRFYIDYEAIARDMAINGEIAEIRHGRIVTNASEF